MGKLTHLELPLQQFQANFTLQLFLFSFKTSNSVTILASVIEGFFFKADISFKHEGAFIQYLKAFSKALEDLGKEMNKYKFVMATVTNK
jgi:hypothetical protein